MKKVIVEKTPPTPASSRMVTYLRGDELIAYVTEKGTICLLFRLSKDYKDKERFGFCNLGYSSSSSPVYADYTWFDAVKKAATFREVYAFDSYSQLMKWITNIHADKTIKVDYEAAEKSVKETPYYSQMEAVKLAGQADRIDFPEEVKQGTGKDYYKPREVDPISREAIDENGAGQVNHTHKNMTILFNTLNEVITAHNNLNRYTKDVLYKTVYSGDPGRVPQLIPAETSLLPYRFSRKHMEMAIALAITKIEDLGEKSTMTGAQYDLKNALETLILNVGYKGPINIIELI